MEEEKDEVEEESSPSTVNHLLVLRQAVTRLVGIEPGNGLGLEEVVLHLPVVAEAGAAVAANDALRSNGTAGGTIGLRGQQQHI